MMAAPASYQQMLQACSAGDLPRVKYLLYMDCTIAALRHNEYQVIRCAAANGHIDVVCFLLHWVDADSHECFQLEDIRRMYESGLPFVRDSKNCEILQCLLEWTEPKTGRRLGLSDLRADLQKNNSVLYQSCFYGNVELVHALLAWTDPVTQESLTAADIRCNQDKLLRCTCCFTPNLPLIQLLIRYGEYTPAEVARYATAELQSQLAAEEPLMIKPAV